MPDWPIGLSTGCFYRTSIFDSLETIRQAGFLMLEICSFPAHLNYRNHDEVRAAEKRIRELGMEPYSFHSPFADDIDISSPDEGARHYAEQEIIRAAESAAILKARHFVIHPGPEHVMHPHAEERLLRMYAAARTLDYVARRCEQLGIGLVLENMLPHLFFGNTRDMLWLMGAMEALKVGTCLDVSHAFLSGDIYRVMYKLSGHLQLMHANDTRGTYDDHLSPGMGITDWRRLLREVHETGFHGGIILEIAGDGQNRPDAEFLAQARTGRRLLRDISRDLELEKPPTVDY